MATLACRVQFLDDTDPFNSTNFPEPSRPPLFTFREDLALGTQLAGVHRLLRAPHKVRARSSDRKPQVGERRPTVLSVSSPIEFGGVYTSPGAPLCGDGVSLVESGVASSQAWKEELDDCTLQLSHNGTYLDLEATLAEQRDELEGFQDDVGRGKKHSIILRTQLSVRVHACIGE
ncbi:FH1/FH2 domain-containing protein 3 [Pteropus alecto]|uniref:FH1/FH2 domain-containing protein 3 n=1 Tax=Pteropus alecto TaxID=9402 RepID=L5K1S5_PTEAL|nr:FH1/FH2 domain-containing protein 3 [Pteropus alecto]